MSVTIIRKSMIKSLDHNNLDSAAGIALAQLAEGDKLIKKDGTVAFTADVDAGTNKVVNLKAGTADNDAATVKQVNDAVAAAVSGAVSGLANPMEIKGEWDPSGALPAAIDKGDVYVITKAGTFQGTAFQEGSEIIAINTKATGVTLADFLCVNRTDQIVKVAGKTGPDITLDIADISGLVAALAAKQDTVHFVDYEVPTGTKDGTNVTFQLANIPTAGSAKVILDGAVLTPGTGNDYVLTGDALVLDVAHAPVATTNFWVSYRH